MSTLNEEHAQLQIAHAKLKNALANETVEKEKAQAELRRVIAQNATVVAENSTLKAKLVDKAAADGFIRRGGLLWRAGGKFPYCPECPSHPLMSAIGGRGRMPMLWLCPHDHQFPRTA